MQEFFDQLKKEFGLLSQAQVDGINIILDESKALPLAHRAYILATAWHETVFTMQSIEEYGKGRGKPYGRKDPKTGVAYYGRGYVQLTWKTNYARATKRLQALGHLPVDVDFVKTPELVMEPTNAAKILVIGMKEGWFTTKKLGDFLDYKSMRTIVNGTDKADEIAGYAKKFENALKAKPAPSPSVIVVKPEPEVKEKPQVEHGVLAWVFGIAIAIAAAFVAWVKNGGQ